MFTCIDHLLMKNNNNKAQTKEFSFLNTDTRSDVRREEIVFDLRLKAKDLPAELQDIQDSCWDHRYYWKWRWAIQSTKNNQQLRNSHLKHWKKPWCDSGRSGFIIAAINWTESPTFDRNRNMWIYCQLSRHCGTDWRSWVGCPWQQSWSLEPCEVPNVILVPLCWVSYSNLEFSHCYCF